MAIDKFNIRVYGILINDAGQILVSEEFIRGAYYTKFPGGGLEFGEGLRDGLVREFKEELGINVVVGDHFYTTDFFQKSAFDDYQQLISVYYFVREAEPLPAALTQHGELKTINETGDPEYFRFIDRENFSEDSVSLAIDKVVAGMLLERVKVVK